MKKTKKVIILVLITLFLELFIFNYRFFEVKFSGLKYDKITKFSASEKMIEKEHTEDKSIPEEDLDDVIYQGIMVPLNQEIKSFKVNLDSKENQDVDISISFTDEEQNYALKTYNNYVYNKSYKNSNYIVLNSEGKCRQLYIYILSKDDFQFQNIEINTWYFQFNLLRFFGIIFIGIIILYWKEINQFFEKSKKARTIAWIVLIVISIAVYAYFCYRHNEVRARFTSSDITYRVNVDPYNLLTESLLNGRIDLNYPYEDTPVNQEEIDKLTSLENTRDISERTAKQVYHYFDVSFYKGKYYCYYGIVPCITVMLPIALITGNIVYSAAPVFVYGSILMILILLIYFEVLKRFNIKLNFIFKMFLYIALFAATGLNMLMSGPTFYQAADLSGLAWGFLGIYLLLKLDNNKRIYTKLFFAGLSFALMVCSRPIYVLYFPIYIILAFKYIVKIKDNKLKINIGSLLSFAIPITIIAILQMIYNYARYENIFEFGQFWQLTINDTTMQKMNIGMSLNGIAVYLFGPPVIQDTFPFLSAFYINVQNGNLIYCEGTYGLICYPFLWSMVIGWNMLKENKKLRLLWIVTIILALLFFAINTCLAGMNQRYTVDIQPCVAIVSFIIWMAYFKKYNTDKRSVRILTYLSIITIIISFQVMFSRAPGISDLLEIREQAHTLAYEIKHALLFYK